MDSLQHLSAPKCVLLAIRYASDANVSALRLISLARRDALQPALVLRIILTYLPESVDPTSYSQLCSEVVSGAYTEEREDVELDLSPLHGISDKKARSRVNKAQLLPLAHSLYADVHTDDLTRFLIHRAHRIDSETGLFDLVPALVVPFLEYSEYLRTWFISTCLPLLRHQYEYYPAQPVISSLDSFVALNGSKAVDTLLSRASGADGAGNNLGRDIRGLVGPWVYGSNERKRRKTGIQNRRHSTSGSANQPAEKSGKHTSERHDWEFAFRWLVERASVDFASVIVGIDDWDGPEDVDLGGYEESARYLDEDVQRELELRYAQATFACAYSVDTDTPETIEGVHSLLVRLASLLDFEPPPDLATSVDMLPKIEYDISILHNTSPTILSPESLMNDQHPLTHPSVKSFSLLQIFLYSTYTLANIGYPLSVKSVAHLRFHNDEDNQQRILQKILHEASSALKNDDSQWEMLRKKLFWLWSWGMDDQSKATEEGFGIFGKIHRSTYEKEILKTLLTAGRYSLITETYVKKSETHGLKPQDVEDIVLGVGLQFYDSASNGNRSRGNMKKASEIITTFKRHFPKSDAFKRTEALLTATHSLSFYALTQQRGVPFQPVNIRVRKDPLSLVEDLLEQNKGSYTKLDDLMEIGRNLVTAGVGAPEKSQISSEKVPNLEEKKTSAEQRVLGMAIKASLEEEDFETAYSYVVNRLHPSKEPEVDGKTKPAQDDGSWRAAFIAGSHSDSGKNSTYQNSVDTTALRRLEQRLELLSQALIAAPPSALAEILERWQECEAEMNLMLAQEAEESEQFDDKADRRLPGEFMNVPQIQPRREVGRGAVEEAPMGLFDVARGAAAAFSRSAFPLQGATKASKPSAAPTHQRTVSAASEHSAGGVGSDDEGQRIRRRDMIANTVTGGLASGLGWVLGATPVRDQDK